MRGREPGPQCSGWRGGERADRPARAVDKVGRVKVRQAAVCCGRRGKARKHAAAACWAPQNASRSCMLLRLLLLLLLCSPLPFPSCMPPPPTYAGDRCCSLPPSLPACLCVLWWSSSASVAPPSRTPTPLSRTYNRSHLLPYSTHQPTPLPSCYYRWSTTTTPCCYCSSSSNLRYSRRTSLRANTSRSACGGRNSLRECRKV